jgi:hypothetical protein
MYGAMTFSITTLSMTTFSIMTLGIRIKCHYSKCCYAECRIFMLNGIVLIVFMLNVIMLSVVIPNVSMLNVVTPHAHPSCGKNWEQFYLVSLSLYNLWSGKGKNDNNSNPRSFLESSRYEIVSCVFYPSFERVFRPSWLVEPSATDLKIEGLRPPPPQDLGPGPNVIKLFYP